MSRLKKALLNLAVFAAIAFGGGLGTAWYMIEAGSRLSTRAFGPWVTWVTAGRPEADPYTRAHVARNGLLPISSTAELTFKAKTDSQGRRLSSSCDYTVIMEDFDPAWWALAVYDNKGRLVTNPAERYSFNSDTSMRGTDGRTVIALARDARPGNWLPSGRGNRIVLVLMVQDAGWAAAVHDGASIKPLPQIVRSGCR
ncbi:MAG TPA: DUF1214 domain-containing protein [Hyphomicrobiaceae bacterium]|nr:DUF1214 domain-containing protein [Hyphomicrobiaceae bacterium]